MRLDDPLWRISITKEKAVMTSDSCTPTRVTSETEQTLAELWSEVLQTAVLPTTTENFFALGGDSIAMVLLEFRIREEFEVDLPAAAVLEAPTLREMATLMMSASSDSCSPGPGLAESVSNDDRIDAL